MIDVTSSSANVPPMTQPAPPRRRIERRAISAFQGSRPTIASPARPWTTSATRDDQPLKEKASQPVRKEAARRPSSARLVRRPPMDGV